MQDKKLTVEDIAIPESVMASIRGCWLNPPSDAIWAVKVALLSLATNPVVPSDEQAKGMEGTPDGSPWRSEALKAGGIAWQKRMFLRKPDPVPEEVKALLFQAKAEDMTTYCSTADERILKAYALGKAHSNDTL